MESQTKSAKEIEDSLMMPPPPAPMKKVLLEPEMNGLSECLKKAMPQAAAIYQHYDKTRKSGITNVHAPQSLTAALGREMEVYDQICDTLELHVLRALAVFRRDLAAEKERILAEEELALKEKQMREERPATPPMEGLHEGKSLKADPTVLINSSPMSTSSLSGRRASIISMSSLHRPSLPGKLDLSSVSFQMPTGDDKSIFPSGLASPVSLAPRSARALDPTDLPPDFMSAFGGGSGTGPGNAPTIDLTLPETMDMQAIPQPTRLDLVAGDSQDKPIELDMDMEDLFGGGDIDSAGTQQDAMSASDLFSEPGGPSQSGDFHDAHDAGFLAALSAAGSDAAAGQSDDILASLPASAHTVDTGSEAFNLDGMDLTDLLAVGVNQPNVRADDNFSGMDFTIDSDMLHESTSKTSSA